MELVIIRHLQTEWNLQGILQGSNDIDILPTNSELQEQIQQQKQILAQMGDFDYVLASELKRTHQTASLYGYENPTVEPLINELNFGQFEGKPRENLISTVGQVWFDDPREVVLGESIADLNQRILNFLKKYQDSPRVLVFAHGCWTRAMMSFVDCGDLRKMNQVQVVNNQLVTLSYNATIDSQSINECV